MVMKKTLIWILLTLLMTDVSAQTAKEEIENNLRLSASSLLAYRGPQTQLTPAPEGMVPFYISHYGRHGSCYMANAVDYDYSYNVLRLAKVQGKLTQLGESVLERLGTIRDDARGRLGDLTKLGSEQHRQIAKRMFERFPEVFSNDAHVDAKSTIVIRCILSMANATQQLAMMNPHLTITQDASSHDMYYMNQNDPIFWKRESDLEKSAPYLKFCKNHDLSNLLTKRLFNDTSYVRRKMNSTRFNDHLFKAASHIQNTELRNQVSLYDVFSDEEVYQNWLRENARSYIGFAASPLNDSMQPFSQRNLLRRIIAEADSCIALPTPSASLRFGHETMVLPLVCLLDLNSYGQEIDDLEQVVRKGWHNYNIFPMAANIQFIFYRRHPGDTDIVFKVLLNEDEATLPLKTDMAPYYHWKDFREHFLSVLDTYVESQ